MTFLVGDRKSAAREAARLRKRGMKQKEIAQQMGLSQAYVSDLLRDPDGSLAVMRKRQYGGTCERCGARTYGGNGRSGAPRVCLTCVNAERAANRAPCGTLARYRGGCRCGDCRRANREWSRERYHAGLEPPSHGLSGYLNYGCKCPVCRRAKTENNYGYMMRYQRKRHVAREIEAKSEAA